MLRLFTRLHQQDSKFGQCAFHSERSCAAGAIDGKPAGAMVVCASGQPRCQLSLPEVGTHVCRKGEQTHTRKCCPADLKFCACLSISDNKCLCHQDGPSRLPAVPCGSIARSCRMGKEEACPHTGQACDREIALWTGPTCCAPPSDDTDHSVICMMLLWHSATWHADMQERCGQFRKWLEEQPQKVIVVVGHSTFWKVFTSSPHRLKNCEVQTIMI